MVVQNRNIPCKELKFLSSANILIFPLLFANSKPDFFNFFLLQKNYNISMKRFSAWLLPPFQNDWKLLLIYSIPACLLAFFGLAQLNLFSWYVIFPTELVKLINEFLFLGILLSLFNLIGLKNKFIVGILAFFYYLTITADLILLWYFKERFGAKYVDTMQGGDYQFLTDPRVLAYFGFWLCFSLGAAWKFFVPSPRKTAFKRGAVCLVGFLILSFLNPLRLLPAPADFYASYLISPSAVYTARALLTKPLAPVFTDEIPPLATQYNVFSAQQTPVGKEYKRVILIASESLSNKYLHHFNENIPAEATQELDSLYENNPSASLKHVTLSTLYGLTVIFSSHPFALLSFNNDYPISFVKELKKNGFYTAFLRGANEQYMQENILFHKAGFDDVIGATYFATRPEYKEYVNWWGLLDRKLFAYAVEHLKKHAHEKTFITLLTVDSHVPLGRLDYLGETYRETENEFYHVPTLPRAFSRFGQDVAIFLENLDKEGLFDTNTLILIMPDHPSYSNTPTNALFTPYQDEFDNLPFIIVTKDKITTPLTHSPLASQLDIAPTVLDLLNLKIPRGMFGHSLFDLSAKHSVFDIKEDYAVITTDNEKRVVPLNSPAKPDSALIDLMRTFLAD